MPPPVAAFTLATYNRKEYLLECIRRALTQTVPIEVTVCDDGSTDGTPEAMASAFPPDKHPNIRYFRFPRGNGPCVLRNLAAALSSAPILFPIDDDSWLSTPTLVEETLRDFNHPRVGAVAIPYINVNKSPREWNRSPNPAEVWITSEYLGASCALRRDLFLGVGGYIEEGFYTGEEWEMSLRLLDSGYVVRLGNSSPIHHQESPTRSTYFQTLTSAQNAIYLPARLDPASKLPIHLLGTTFNHTRHGLRNHDLKPRLHGLLKGLQLSLEHRHLRHPVGTKAYTLMRQLRAKAQLPLTQIEPHLPPLRPLPKTPTYTNPTEARTALAHRRTAWST